MMHERWRSENAKDNMLGAIIGYTWYEMEIKRRPRPTLLILICKISTRIELIQILSIFISNLILVNIIFYNITIVYN